MASSASATGFRGGTPAEQDIVQKIVSRTRLWEETIGKEFRLKNQRLYDQYRGFTSWDDQWNRTSAKDKNGYLYEAEKKWGAKLHIPLSFRTIETVVPRAIANFPRLLYFARDERYEDNVEAVQMLIDAQQEQIDIDLRFQSVMRSGEIYGLGVSKTFWDRQVQMRRRMRERRVPLPVRFGGTHYLAEPEEDVIFDDPRMESVDIFDWLWDPYGYNMTTCGWTAHKLWLTDEGVMARLPPGGSWNTDSAAGLDEEGVKGLTGGDKEYEEVMRHRLAMSGFHATAFRNRDEKIHELIEYHSGDQVISVLDRQVLVETGENPCRGMPFQVYRPTELEHQMVGIGSLEPLEHLQRELDTLRSQRRDLVTLALCAGYAYDATAVDPEDLQFGPAAAIEVDGDPRQALMPLGVKEVPGAGYQEEAAIIANMNDVAGLTDALDNSSPGGSQTATEAQMVQATLGKRIELKSKRFELEIVRPGACQFLYLDQRKIKEMRTLTLPTAPEQYADPDVALYKWVELGPGDLEGEYEIRVEGGSLAARNTAQDRADAAQLFNTLAGDWFTNPTMVREQFYRLMGFKNPKAWLRSPEPSVPQSALRYLVQLGYDPYDIAEAVLRSRETSAPQEGPAAEQLTAMSGAPTSEGAPQ